MTQPKYQKLLIANDLNHEENEPLKNKSKTTKKTTLKFSKEFQPSGFSNSVKSSLGFQFDAKRGYANS